jgi:hypothetical protein
MSWFRVDDGFVDHPKVIALRAGKHAKGALALWTLAGAHSSKHLTDGFVAVAVLAHLGGTTQEADALVAVNLWTKVEGGYQFHEWDERNPTKAKVLAARAVDAARKRKGGAEGFRAESNRIPGGVQVEPPTPLRLSRPGPSQPVPSRLTSFAERARQLATIATTANGGIAHRDTKHFDHVSWVDLARFAIAKAAAIEATPEDVLKHTIGAWGQSKKAKESGWCSAYLAQNPEEWFQLGTRAA